MTEPKLSMSETLVEQLGGMTSENGYVPFITNVQIITSLDAWTRRNLGVAVMKKKANECSVFIHCNEPDSQTEARLRENIVAMFDSRYDVAPGDMGAPIMVSAKKPETPQPVEPEPKEVTPDDLT